MQLTHRIGEGAKATVIPVLVGVLSFFVVTGGRTLNPRNVAWLNHDDPATYFLGWHFFRTTPWSFPLGASPRYGAELGSSIAFVDNIPLLAFPFKLFDHWLPTPFQYFGIWTLICFVLHAWFAWLLVGLLTESRFARACGTTLFVFAPPFLWRLQGHFQMEGQWQILAAMYLCFGPRRLARGPAWPILAFVVSLVHSYTTAMVLGFWLCDWLRRALFEKRALRDLWQLALVPGLVVLCNWQAGLFMINGITTDGFGYYRMNLHSLIDASGWSYLLPDLPEGKGDYEGFNYLGLGGILLALAVLPALKGAFSAVLQKRWYWAHVTFLLGLTLFSISNNIGLGTHTFAIPLSQKWIDRANVLRTGGRMFWPVFYCLSWVILRALFKRYSPRAAATLLCVAAVVQAVDTSAGWRPIRSDLMIAGSTWDSPLKSDIWSHVPDNYREIRMIFPKNHEPGYAVFGYFAGMHHMATDAIYVARIDEQKLKRARTDASAAVRRGKYAPHTLYIILDRYAERLARKSLNPATDLLEKIDGFSVLAPGWLCRPECAGVSGSASDCSSTCPKP